MTQHHTLNETPTSHSGGLNIDVALRFLDAHRELAMATLGGGLPRIRAFQIMRVATDGGAVDLFFATAPFKAVYNQLHETPYVEMLATAGTVSVRMGGEASFYVAEPLRRELYAAPGNEVFRRLYPSFDKLAYARVRLSFMDYFDDAPVPCIYEHWEF